MIVENEEMHKKLLKKTSLYYEPYYSSFSVIVMNKKTSSVHFIEI